MQKSSITTGKKPVTSNKLTTSIILDHLLQLAFDNTAQANIITTSSNGKIIMANSAACKLLGYSKKALLTQSRSTVFDIKESSFKKMLKQRTAEGKSKALVTAIKKGGKTFTCEITSAVFMDLDGIEKAITTITDMSLSILKQKNIDTGKEKTVADNIVLEQEKSDARLAENNEWIKFIAKASYDVMWDWDIATNEIYTGDSAEEVFGYAVENNLVHFTDFISCLLPEEKNRVEKKLRKALASGFKSWNDSFMFIRKNGSVASTTSRASIIRDEQGKAIRLIGAFQDVSRVQELEKKLNEQRITQGTIRETFLQVANISFDVIWDRNLLTNEVIRGEGFEELLGYPLKDYQGNVSDWSNHIHPNDRDAVEIGLQEAITSSATHWEHGFRIIKADGSIAKVFDRASIFRQPDGKAYRMIGAMQDLSRQKELEEKLEQEMAAKEKSNRRLAESNENFFLTTKFSTDLLWEWDLASGEISVSNDIANLFGYQVKNKKGKASDWIQHVHPQDREELDQTLHKAIVSFADNWQHGFRFIWTDGSIVHVLGRAGIKRLPNGKASHLIGALQDLSKQKALEERLEKEMAGKEEHEQKLKLIFNSSVDLMYDVDLAANEVKLSDAYEKEFGYKITSHMTPENNWLKHIHPNDKEAVMQAHQKRLVSKDTELKNRYRYLRADDSVVYVESSGIILRHADGKAYRIIGSMHDISKQTMLEEKLVQEIRLKEKQVAEAAEEAKEAERSQIGKELHDNVNQLLGASRLYLEMAKRGGADSELYLSRSSEYTMEAIEEIRKLTKGLTTDTIKSLGLCEAIENIAQNTMEVNPVNISCALDSFIENRVNNKFKLNVYRIVQEHLNNIIKHAKAKQVTINLSQNKKSILLIISDDGIGFDINKKQKGIGLANIKSRAASYNGTAHFVSQPGKGCVVTVTFPVTNALLMKN